MDLFPAPAFTPTPTVEPLGPFRAGNWDSAFDEFRTEPPAGAAAEGSSHPFKAIISDPTAPSAKIVGASRIYKSLSPTDTITITSLTSVFTLTATMHVWVEVPVASLAPGPGSAALRFGTAWPSFVVTSGSPAVQTQFNVPVGRVTASNPEAPGFEFVLGGTTYHFEQCLFNHLLVEDRCVNGSPAIYAFPFGGAA